MTRKKMTVAEQQKIKSFIADYGAHFLSVVASRAMGMPIRFVVKKQKGKKL